MFGIHVFTVWYPLLFVKSTTHYVFEIVERTEET